MEALDAIVGAVLGYGPLGILVIYLVWDRHMTRKKNGNGHVAGHDTQIALIEQRLDSIEKKSRQRNNCQGGYGD